MSHRGYQVVPYPLDTPEWESFKNYAKTYYQEAMQIAENVSGGLYKQERIYMTILNACTSPLVFLWEKWQLMTSQARLPYATPEYKIQLEKQIAQAKETLQKAEEKGFGKT